MGKPTTGVDRPLPPWEDRLFWPSPTDPGIYVFNLDQEMVFEYEAEDGGIRTKVRRRDGSRRWDSRKVKVRTLYRYPELRKAIFNHLGIVIVDGEKDADSLNDVYRTFRMPFFATCVPHGMGSWRDEHSKQLEGVRHLWIVADRDTAKNGFKGQQSALAVQASVRKELGLRAAIAEAQAGKDAYDHLVAGYDCDIFSAADLSSEPYSVKSADVADKAKPAVEIVDKALPAALQLAVERLEAMPEVGLRKSDDDPPKWQGRCPLPEHDDEHPSFAIGLGDRVAVVVICSGCEGSKDEFAAVLGIDPREFSVATATTSPDTQGEGVDGATFILDGDTEVVALWGRNDQVLHAKDEGFIICGPQGVGKSTVAQQLALHMIGALDGPFLGFPVEPIEGKVLYLAMDRRKQIARSFARMVGEEHREVLSERLVVWPRPLQTNILKEPANLANWIEEKFGKVALIIVDSYKDLAPGLSQDDVGSRVNLAAQEVISRGVQWVGLHHQKKAQSDNKRPDKLSDVYGSEWLTAGMGSVALLWGQPGSSNIELRHLKQPMETVGPLSLVHDHKEGRTFVSDYQRVVLELLNENYNEGDSGVPEDEITIALFSVDGDVERKRAQRILVKFRDENAVWKEEGKRGGRGGGGVPAKWHLKMGG